MQIFIVSPSLITKQDLEYQSKTTESYHDISTGNANLDNSRKDLNLLQREDTASHINKYGYRVESMVLTPFRYLSEIV